MRRAVLIFLAVFAAGWVARGLDRPSMSDVAEIPRYSQAEKRELFQSQGVGPVRIPADVAFVHPHVASVAVEDSTVKLAPDPTEFRSWVTYRVLLNEPVESDEAENISRAIRKVAGRFDAVGVRLVLPGFVAAERDPGVSPPMFAWHLFVDGEKTISLVYGLTPSVVAQQARAVELRDGEKLDGVWVDHSFANGAVALVSRGADRYLIFLFDPRQRYLLRKRAGAGDAVWDAVQKEGPYGTFAADGDGTDVLAARLSSSGDLEVFGGGRLLASKPWLIAKRI